MKKPYILAVTGPTRPPSSNTSAARKLYRLAEYKIAMRFGVPSELMTGCAFGIDTDSINFFLHTWKSIKVINLIVPAAPYNVAWVNTFLNGVHPDMPPKIVIRRMPRRKNQTAAKSYMERNTYLADNADVCAAFPHTTQEELRSGTWATIRRFERRDKAVVLRPISTVSMDMLD